MSENQGNFGKKFDSSDGFTPYKPKFSLSSEKPLLTQGARDSIVLPSRCVGFRTPMTKGDTSETFVTPGTSKGRVVMDSFTLNKSKTIGKQKSDADRRGYTKPDYGLDREKERALVHAATKGVVQLFNAVADRQKFMDKKLEATKGRIKS